MAIRPWHASSPGTARTLLLLSVAALVALVAGLRVTGVHVRHELDGPHVPQGATTWRQIDGKAMNDAIGFDPTLSGGRARPVVRGLRRRCRAVAGICRPERGGVRGVPTRA